MSHSAPASAATGTQELKAAVAAINASGTVLDTAAAKIVDVIGLPSFQQAMAERPELRALEPLRAVDLISSSLAESLFVGAADDQDVLIELDGELVTVPAGQRELLQSAVTRALGAKIAAVGTLLKAKA
ncbi:hypothetical protein ACLQ2R_22165 [Streptosporangium sp. DT93]|uniref:hypothetical protein n=1 Tax=Streptosporangium sp. DT93 TaxID=3393428 RepID=UPI003CF80233